MGQSQSCNQLNEFRNACEISNCIERVRGLDSNSSSPTDTWILTFKNDTKYENVNIRSGFLKFFIDPSTLPSSYEDIDVLKALNYEIQVYKDIIRPLVDSKICPNFIRYLGSGKSCSYESMINILEDKTYKGKTNRNNKTIIDPKNLVLKTQWELEESFQDNFNHMYEGKLYRKSINTDLGGERGMVFAYDYKYNLLVNETIPNDSYTLDQYIERLEQSGTRLNKLSWCIIFQIMIACYAMSLAKMGHNDLHHQNLYIIPDNKPLNYVLGSKGYIFSIKIGRIIKIYDFDRSYSERLGINEYLVEDWAKEASQSNDFIPNRDMIKVFGYIYERVQRQDQEIIEKIIAKPGHDKFLSSVYNRDKFLRNPFIYGDDKALKPDDYTNRFNTAEEILMQVAMLSGTEVTDPKNKEDILRDTDNLYVCIPSVFSTDGRIIGQSVSKQYSYLMQTQMKEGTLDDEIKKKESEIKVLNRQVAGFKDIIDKKTSEFEEKVSKIEKKESEIVKLTRKQDEIEDDIDTLKKRKEDIEHDIATLNHQSSEITRLTESLVLTTAQLQQKENDIKMLAENASNAIAMKDGEIEGLMNIASNYEALVAQRVAEREEQLIEEANKRCGILVAEKEAEASRYIQQLKEEGERKYGELYEQARAEIAQLRGVQ